MVRRCPDPVTVVGGRTDAIRPLHPPDTQRHERPYATERQKGPPPVRTHRGRGCARRQRQPEESEDTTAEKDRTEKRTAPLIGDVLAGLAAVAVHGFGPRRGSLVLLFLGGLGGDGADGGGFPLPRVAQGDEHRSDDEQQRDGGRHPQPRGCFRTGIGHGATIPQFRTWSGRPGLRSDFGPGTVCFVRTMAGEGVGSAWRRKEAGRWYPAGTGPCPPRFSARPRHARGGDR